MNTLVLELLNLNAQKSSILSNNTEKNLFSRTDRKQDPVAETGYYRKCDQCLTH